MMYKKKIFKKIFSAAFLSLLFSSSLSAEPSKLVSWDALKPSIQKSLAKHRSQFISLEGRLLYSVKDKKVRIEALDRQIRASIVLKAARRAERVNKELYSHAVSQRLVKVTGIVQKNSKGFYLEIVDIELSYNPDKKKGLKPGAGPDFGSDPFNS